MVKVIIVVDWSIESGTIKDAIKHKVEIEMAPMSICLIIKCEITRKKLHM
jgi:hypothetical protein